MSCPDVTVAIPLHRSERWLSSVAANVRRIGLQARILISDATEEDPAFKLLQHELSDQPQVEWHGARDLAPGYVAHYNDLLARCTTPYFMWLPADDEIDAGYVEACTQALRQDPSLIMAVGHVVSMSGPGLCDPEFPLMPDEGGSQSGISRISTLLLDWEPWILFRSVFRVSALHEIRDTDQGIAADTSWILGLLGKGRAAQVPGALYRKRFYPDSTHVLLRNPTVIEKMRWSNREISESVGKSRAAITLAVVGAHRATRRVLRRGYRHERVVAPCGHTFCARDLDRRTEPHEFRPRPDDGR